MAPLTGGSIWITLAVLVIVICFEAVVPDCSPVLQGDSASITCTVNVGNSCPDSDRLRWEIQFEDGSKDRLADCKISECDSYSTRHVTNITGTDPIFDSTFTIKSAIRGGNVDYESKYLCTDLCQGSTFTACEQLKIYVLPENPTCTAREYDLQGDAPYIRVVCNTSKVYPEADCTFYHFNNSLLEGESEHSTGTPTKFIEDDLTYYSHQCEANFSLSDLGPGTHSFQGRIYPDVTNGTSLPKVENTPAPGEFVYYLPVVTCSCDAEQISGYFKGKKAECKLTMTDDGEPNGMAHWYENGLKRSDLNDTLILEHSLPAQDPIAVFTCKGESAIGVNEVSRFSPLFAFLDADSVEVLIPDSTLCLNDTDETTVTCQVSKQKANPGVNISFSINGGTFTEAQAAVDAGSYYQLQYNFRPDQTGQYQIKCRAVNSIYSDMVVEGTSSSSISVTEIYDISLTHNGTAELSVGQTLALTCDSPGNPTQFVTLNKENDDPGLATNGTGSVQYEISNLTCDDLGRFICTASNAGCQDIYKMIEVNVTCPPQLFNDSKKVQKYGVSKGGSLTVNTTIKSYPPVTEPYSRLEMQRDDGTYEDAPSRHQHFLIPVPGVTSEVISIVTFTSITQEDFTTCKVTEGNGESTIAYTIDLYEEATRSSSSSKTTLVVGICAALGLVIIIIIVVIVYKKKKRNDSCCCCCICCCCRRQRRESWFDNC